MNNSFSNFQQNLVESLILKTTHHCGLDLEEEKEQPPNESLPNMAGSNMPPGDMMDMFQLKQFEMDDDMGDISEIKRFENITSSIAEKKRYIRKPLII